MEKERAAECMHLMMTVLRAHRSICEQHVSRLGIHHSQHRILMKLSKKDCPPSQKELASELEVSPAAIAVTLKKLEHGGYIKRNAFDGDMRQNRIEITLRGRELVELTRSMYHSVDSRMFEGLSPEELDGFYSCLLRMYDNVIGEEKRFK